MAMFVEYEIAKLLEVLLRDLLDDTLGDDGDAVVVPRQVALDNRPRDDVDDLLQGNRLRRELLGNDRQSRACRAPHT